MESPKKTIAFEFGLRRRQNAAQEQSRLVRTVRLEIRVLCFVAGRGDIGRLRAIPVDGSHAGLLRQVEADRHAGQRLDGEIDRIAHQRRAGRYDGGGLPAKGHRLDGRRIDGVAARRQGDGGGANRHRPRAELVREHDAQLIAADADAGDLPDRLTLEGLRHIERRRQFLGPARRRRRGPGGDPRLRARCSRGAGRRGSGKSQHSDRKACRRQEPATGQFGRAKALEERHGVSPPRVDIILRTCRTLRRNNPGFLRMISGGSSNLPEFVGSRKSGKGPRHAARAPKSIAFRLTTARGRR